MAHPDAVQKVNRAGANLGKDRRQSRLLSNAVRRETKVVKVEL